MPRATSWKPQLLQPKSGDALSERQLLQAGLQHHVMPVEPVQPLVFLSSLGENLYLKKTIDTLQLSDLAILGGASVGGVCKWWTFLDIFRR